MGMLAAVAAVLLAASLLWARRALAGVTSRLVDAQRAADSERARLSRELHDGVGQRLIALKLQLQLSRMPGVLSTASHEETLDMIDEIIEEVRGMARTVRPAPFDNGLLVPALTALARSEAGRAGLSVLVDAPDEDFRVAYDAEVACYHAAREALANVIKHSRAKNVAVSFESGPAALIVNIADDGCGFDVDAVSRRATVRGRLGMVGMRDGLKRAGGALHITSEAGVGTTVTCRVPLEAAA